MEERCLTVVLPGNGFPVALHLSSVGKPVRIVWLIMSPECGILGGSEGHTEKHKNSSSDDTLITHLTGKEARIIWQKLKDGGNKQKGGKSAFCVFTLPWTLSRIGCWASPAALVARQVYFPESSSFASLTFNSLPADSHCDRQKWNKIQENSSW